MTKKMRPMSLCLTLLIFLSFILVGCSSETLNDASAADTIPSATTKRRQAEKREILTVYLLNQGGTEGYAIYAKDYASKRSKFIDVQIEEFTELGLMEERLKVELPAGKGPDLILAETDFGLDMMSLAKNDTFYDMTDIIAADDTFHENNYYLPVMKGGQINDRQYIIPLAFTVSTFASTASALEAAGIDWEQNDTIEVYEQILRFLQTDSTPKITGVSTYQDIASALLITVGKNPATYGTDTFLLTDRDVRTVLKLAAECYRQNFVWKTGHNDFSTEGFYKAATQLPLHYAHFWISPYEYPWMYSGYAATGKGDEFKLYFPSADLEGNIQAQISHFAAVTQGAENPELAWEMIRYIIDQPPAKNGFSSVSLNRGIMEYIVESFKHSHMYGDKLEFLGLPNTYIEQILDAYDRITGGVILQNAGASKIINDAIINFATGEVDFDTMLSDMSSKLNIYVNE